MNIQQVKETLPILMKHDIVPFLWGVQGVGKTETVKQIAKEQKVGFVHLHLATQEVGDLVGLLKHNDDDGTVSHARPEWLPTDGNGILFLDELNRAHPDVLQAVFSLIMGKTIHQHALPNGWKIVAAGNYASGEFTTTDMSDKALMSRFCHIDFEPTAEEFIAYADSIGAASVAGFISEDKSCLESSKREKPEHNVTPDRRAWLKMIAPLENEKMGEAARFEIYSGIIGPVAASAFVNWKKSEERKIRIADILNDYPKHREKVKKIGKGKKEARFDLISAPLEELVTKLKMPENQDMLKPEHVENLKDFFLDVPRESVLATIKKLAEIPKFAGKYELMDDKEFVGRLFE